VDSASLSSMTDTSPSAMSMFGLGSDRSDPMTARSGYGTGTGYGYGSAGSFGGGGVRRRRRHSMQALDLSAVERSHSNHSVASLLAGAPSLRRTTSAPILIHDSDTPLLGSRDASVSVASTGLRSYRMGSLLGFDNSLLTSSPSTHSAVGWGQLKSTSLPGFAHSVASSTIHALPEMELDSYRHLVCRICERTMPANLLSAHSIQCAGR
jgi:hypothetical protein